MFEAIQYLVSSKKLEDGYGMDNVAVVNDRGKLQVMWWQYGTRSYVYP